MGVEGKGQPLRHAQGRLCPSRNSPPCPRKERRDKDGAPLSVDQEMKAGRAPFWLERYYDSNVWSKEKFTEKLRYIHRNPVRRGSVERQQDWAWSSFRHYATGVEGVVEIESQWTGPQTGATTGLDASDCPKTPPRLCKELRDKDGAPSGAIPSKQMCLELNRHPFFVASRMPARASSWVAVNNEKSLDVIRVLAGNLHAENS